MVFADGPRLQTVLLPSSQLVNLKTVSLVIYLKLKFPLQTVFFFGLADPWGIHIRDKQSYLEHPGKLLSGEQQVMVQSWWHHQMETFSALLALCVGISSVTGEFPSQRPVTQSFDIFFDLRLDKRLSKQSWGEVIWDTIAHYDVILIPSMNKPLFTKTYVAIRRQ